MSQPEEPQAKRPLPGPETTLREMFTDRKAMFDSLVPPLLFVSVNAFAGLMPAAVAAASLGVGATAYRLYKRQRIQYALSGLLGLGLALLLAVRSGKASNYFLPNVVIGAAYGVVAVISALVGRPISGYIAKLTEAKPQEWYRLPRVRNAHVIVTLVWGLFFLARSGIRYMLIEQDRVAALGFTAVALGFPATAILLVASYAFLKARTKDVTLEPDLPPG